MPRNSSGTMSLPSPGVPFQSGTTISTTQMNATLTDLATEISDSASRSGKGGFSAPVRVPDGTAAAPAVAFTAEINSGVYRAGANDVRFTIGGVDFITPNGIAFPGAGGFGPVLSSTVSGKSVTVQGNLTATSGAADVQIGSTVTRTAGFIATFQNPIVAANKLLVDYQGLLTLGNQAAAIQPAAMVTAITPNAGLTAAGCAYWKDACGMVHLEGAITNVSGGSVTNIATTTPLPAGFRGSANMAAIGTIGPVQVSVQTSGVITTAPALANGNQLFLDGLSFRATG